MYITYIYILLLFITIIVIIIIMLLLLLLLHIYIYIISHIYITYIIWGITHLQSGMHPQVGLLRPPDLALGSRGKSFLKLSVNEPETLNQIYPLVN